MKRLENKIAIITGGASGIGKATAEKFVQEGAKVIIWDLDEKKGNELANALGATFAKVNTSNYQEIEQAAKAVNDEFGRIDILINTPTKANDSLRDGFRIRRTAIEYGVEVLTSLDTLNAVIRILEQKTHLKDVEVIDVATI